jgi:hypothetical protein
MVLVEVGEAETFDATSWGIVAPDVDVHKARRTATQVDVVRCAASCTPWTNLKYMLVLHIHANRLHSCKST